MKAISRFCLTLPHGEDIYLFTLFNSRGTKVSISNYGAIITSFVIVQPGGVPNDIVLGFDKMDDYFSPEYLANYPWFGAAIGRYGNRIRNASINIDGIQYELSKNIGNDQLHGGREGFDRKVWQLKESGDSFLVLAYSSEDGEEGFPGRLDVTLRIELSQADELSYEYTASTDKPTAVNLTHHSYFNLENGTGTIDEHEVRIPADHILEQDANLVATGRLLPVVNTNYDFTSRRKIHNINQPNGYDQSFILRNQGKEEKLAAEAWSPASGLKLEVWTTEPTVHFYTGRYIPVIRGKHRSQYGPYSAFCLETQVHPNAINIPHFPDTILRPGNLYRHKTTYRIIQDE